jgi:MFS transporter, PPP family, 3-phenylpropionic acid transporter
MGAISALLPLMTVLGPPGFGMLADALGLRGALLRWASLGCVLSFGAIYVCSQAGHTLGFTELVVCIFLFGFFRTPMGLLADVVALEQGGDYARTRLFGSLGFMLTAPLVGRFVDLRSASALPAVILGGLVAGHVATWFLPTRGSVPRQAPWSDVLTLLQRAEFRAFLLTVMLAQTAHVGYDVTLSMHLADLGMSGSQIGLAWAIGTGAEIVLMYFSAPLLRRYNSVHLLIVSLAVGTLRWILMACTRDPLWVLAYQPLHAISFAVRWLACMQIVREHSSEGGLGTLQGVHLAAFSSGSVLGTLLFGGMYKQLGGAQIYSLIAVCSAFAVLSSALLLFHHRRAHGVKAALASSVS